MSDETLVALFNRVFKSSIIDRKFTVTWHAGEPLVVPRRFYERALKSCNEANDRGVQVTFNVQTNATLIDREWATFLKRHNFSVGVSIDGPSFIHDANRRYRSGRGTFDAVIRGITHLRELDVRFDVIAVISRQTLDYPDEFLDFFSTLGVHSVGFNIEESEGVHKFSSVDAETIKIPLPKFLNRLAQRYVEGLPYGIREYDGLFKLLQSNERYPPRQQVASPFRIINVDVDGNFSTFSPELLGHNTPYGKLNLGNVRTDDFETLTSHPVYKAAFSDIERGIELCREGCEYFQLCGGGSPSNKFFENGTFASSTTKACNANIKAVIDSFLGALT